jgi:hypothetical protein
MRPLVILITEVKNMDGKIKYSSEKSKTKKKKNFEISFSKEDFQLVLIFSSLVTLMTNENFLKFVVEIVKLLLNRSFYYFYNNRIFVFKEVFYES